MKPEGYTFTGRGGIKGKPVSSDRKSMKSPHIEQTGEDSLLEALHSSSLGPRQTISENQVVGNIDSNQGTEVVQELSMFFPG
jgi:hypothetical protein